MKERYPVSNYRELAKAAGVTDDILSDTQRSELDELGYTVIPIPDERWNEAGISLDELRRRVDDLVEAEGTFAGREGKEDVLDGVTVLEPGAKRLANLVNKGDCFRSLMLLPELLAAADQAIKSEFRISSINFREPLPGQNQRIHIDWMPRQNEDGPKQFGLLAMVFLDASEADNGPLRVLPRTHLMTGWPDDHLNPYEPHPDEVFLTAPAGSVVAMNINLFHGGTINVSGKRRRTIMVNYRRREIPQLLNQRRYLSPAVMSDLIPAERYLLSVRPEDPVQKEDSVGVAAAYTAAWGTTGIARPR